jgi:hypothetical protein
MDRRKLAEVPGHSCGVIAAARGQGCAKQLEKPCSSRTRNRRKQGSRITDETRKSVERREGGGGATGFTWNKGENAGAESIDLE